jgi:hypothetical protein
MMAPMPTNLFSAGAAAVTAVSFLVNLPLGYARAPARRFSVRWFVLVHLSIPLIVFLRFWLRLHPLVIPFNIAAAVAGQVVGARWYHKRQERPRLQ